MDDATVWHEDERFWETVQAFIFPPETIEEAPEQVDDLLALLDLDTDASVLDIPCGIGRHSVVLANRGFDVTAVDATGVYLETANRRARDAGVDVEFVRQDMREFCRQDEFDAIYNLYTSFGYFEDREDDRRTAENFYASLAPGGQLVMSLTSKETLAGTFEERTWHERDGTYFLEEHEITDNWSWIENQWVVLGEEQRRFAVSHRLYSAFELTQLLEQVGFDAIAVYGDLEGSEYDETADHLVIVARA